MNSEDPNKQKKNGKEITPNVNRGYKDLFFGLFIITSLGLGAAYIAENGIPYLQPNYRENQRLTKEQLARERIQRELIEKQAREIQKITSYLNRARSLNARLKTVNDTLWEQKEYFRQNPANNWGELEARVRSTEEIKSRSKELEKEVKTLLEEINREYSITFYNQNQEPYKALPQHVEQYYDPIYQQLLAQINSPLFQPFDWDKLIAEIRSYETMPPTALEEFTSDPIPYLGISGVALALMHGITSGGSTKLLKFLLWDLPTSPFKKK